MSHEPIDIALKGLVFLLNVHDWSSVEVDVRADGRVAFHFHSHGCHRESLHADILEGGPLPLPSVALTKVRL